MPKFEPDHLENVRKTDGREIARQYALSDYLPAELFALSWAGLYRELLGALELRPRDGSHHHS